MREPRSPGAPEEKAPPPGSAGHVGLPGAVSALLPGAGGWRHRACLPAWPQGVRPRGAQGRRVRVLRAACVPALPHHLRRVPGLQHLPVSTARRREAPSAPRPFTGLPTAAALGRPPPGLATPAAPAGRGPAGCPGPAQQQYASHRARTEGAASSPAAATALQGGGATPARQTWMTAARQAAAGPSAASAPRAVTGVRVGRDTARLPACPREAPPGWPRTPRQKLELVLAPLHSLASRALEHGLPDPGSLLAHSLQQLDRIDSLSEQISFLEEQLGSCSCKKEV
ncbi:epidermal growth factor-like protein 7 isoform X2 [Hippopotamus amphibius kiboko]|uniref:epidermal growth factor-like protein 7 isoform X2 n=1 Tax=Hippopotamus amphibius kiboko TaxID=575201 RepID=UPI002597606C|nr:epidermal growth factor-like protein 7 isoform X2 [Hippopotamus amphibius kiboko]